MGSRTRRVGELALLLLTALASGCSTSSRLLRISPLSSQGASDPQRFNGWPLVYADSAGAAVLWPLMDVDRHGFAVRPLVSRDDSNWDVLFPLSHFDVDRGEGWALTGYSLHDNVGLFPLCNFGPSLNYFTPAIWSKEGGRVTNWGVVPIAFFDRESGNGYFLTGYSFHGEFGVFPLFHRGPQFNYAGPLWWTHDGDELDHYGFFPLATGGPRGSLHQIGPVWWKSGDDGCGGLFPLVWSFDGGSKFLAAPFYFHDVEPDHMRRALLLPPTWWETRGADEHHFVFPFYAHVADATTDLTAVPPFFAKRTTPSGSQWFSPVANGWHTRASDGDSRASAAARSIAESRGLNVYPLYWSSSSRSTSSASPSDPPSTSATNLMLPLWLYRERGDERSLITPLGGRGWDASGATHFTNVLGPVYHHSVGPDSETTAFAWPLFERDREGDTTHTRAIPFFGRTERPGSSDTWMAAGLARHVRLGESSSFRAWPLYAQSDAPESPDLLFDATLVGRHSFGDAWSSHVFPLYWGHGDGESSSHTALLGLARAATTHDGSAWRMLPLASSSDDPAAEGWLDRATLFRHERRGEVVRDWLAPLYFGRHGGGVDQQDLLLGLVHHERSDDGSAWRVWPFVSTTDDDSVDSLWDSFTLVGVHPHREKTHVHVGTSLVFGVDTLGEKRDSWRARALLFFTCGDEKTPPPAESKGDAVVERRHAGFFFDRFLVEGTVVESAAGERHDERHLRLPFLHEYRATPAKKEWDLLCYTVHSTTTADEDDFSVLWKGYRRTTRGELTTRDVFPFVTYDTDRDLRRFTFLWRLFHYERRGDKIGGHVLFVPWGDVIPESLRTSGTASS
jgi:hypothetical protein